MPGYYDNNVYRELNAYNYYISWLALPGIRNGVLMIEKEVIALLLYLDI